MGEGMNSPLRKEIETFLVDLPQTAPSTIKLSVVISAYHRSRQLIRSLVSWACQDWVDFELVIVSDGYLGGVVEVCEAFAQASPIPLKYIKLDSKPLRAGPTNAWNAGLRASSGEVLACTHPEVMVSRNAARALYGSVACNVDLLSGLSIHLGDSERTSVGCMLGEKAPIHTGLRVYRLNEGLTNLLTRAEACDISALLELPKFWNEPSEFGGLTNTHIKEYDAFFWNNLWGMSAATWEWMNYLRPSEEWGADDTDLQNRAKLLGLKYVFPEGAFGIHQWHDASCRGPFSDIKVYETQEEARLVELYPETAGVTLESIIAKRSHG